MHVKGAFGSSAIVTEVHKLQNCFALKQTKRFEQSQKKNA